MWVKLLLLFFVFSFLFKADHSFNQDLGRHLKIGEIIVKTGHIPKNNLFSYTNPDFPFINTHWLFEVWVYLTSQALGMEILLVVKIITLLVSIWVIFRIIPKSSQVLLLTVGFIFLHLLRGRTELRPEIFSFFFTAVSYYILDKFQKNQTRLIFLLPLIQLAWINTHIYFFVGLALQAIFLINLFYQHLFLHTRCVRTKYIIIVLLLSVFLSLINPNGLAGLLYPLNVTNNYGYTIVENQTMFLLESINFIDANFIFVKISLAVIVLWFILLLVRRQFELKNILLACFGAVLALMNVRSFPYLVFISLPAVLQNPLPIKLKVLVKSAAATTAILLIIESMNNLKANQFPNLKFAENGRKALDFVLDKDLPGPVYNNFDIGSYIIYRGYPKYKVFVDGRPEAYPKEFFQQVYIPSQSDYSKFQELEKLNHFKTIIFSVTDLTPWGRNFLTAVAADKSWKVVYLDNFIVVMVKI